MKLKLIQQVIFMSKLALFGLLIQSLLFTVLIARDGKAQKSIEEIYVDIGFSNANIGEIIKGLESKTEFSFIYEKRNISKIDMIFNYQFENESLGNILRKVAEESGLAFKRINNNITIKEWRVKMEPLEEAFEGITYQQKISGKITSDEDGEPLPGVSILVKGTTNGTTSDLDGNYSLMVPEGSSLQFSYIGYNTQEIVVGNQTEINIVLEQDLEQLDEVVVVGYGTQKKVNVIGSVSQIDSKDIENRPVSQLSNALVGQMAGVTVIQRSGKPGSSSEIRVRGVGSFGATPSALVLVDGIPGSLNEINPDDIKSISVLKDASSAAIYGARSANGVILITTKNGQKGKMSVSYNGYVGITSPTEYPDLAESWEYAEMFNIASGSNSYTADDIAKFKSGEDPDNYPNTNFLDEVFSRNGVQTSHNVSLSGGLNSHKYFLSVGYLNQQGLVEKNDYERFNVRLNLESELTKNLTLTTRVALSTEERNEPQATANKGGNFEDQLIQNAVRYPSVFLGQASNGDFGIGPESGGTPVAWLQSASYRYRPTSKAGINGRLDWKPIEGLTLSAIGGYNFTLDEDESYHASMVLNPQVNLALSDKTQSRNKNLFKTMQYLAEYGKDINGHSFKILAGYSFENAVTSYFDGFRQNFPSNDYTSLTMGGIDNQQVNGFDEEWAIQSLFGRLVYQYNDKFLFETTVRRDGSSRFPENQKYATFPSMALGWRVIEEDFMQNITWLSNLKLKASWGILGNQNIGNYPYQATLASGRDYPIGTSVSTGAAYATYKDPNIHWESTETYDLGFESGFFDDRLRFNATYFNRNTYDVLYTPSSSVSAVLGVGIGETNTGKVKNAGWEFELAHENNLGDFRYNIQGNLTIIQNEVVTLGLGNVNQPNGLVGNGSDLFIGYPMQMYYGYLSDGVFLGEDDINAWADQTKVTPNAQAGDIRYKDISGPDGVPDGVVDPTYDRTYLGSRIPKYTFSMNMGMQYKNFDFSAFLQGVAGVKGRMEGYAGYAFFNLGSIQQWQMDGRFNPDSPERYPEYPRLEVLTNSGSPNTQLSDFWVISSSYLRIKNLQIGYTIPNLVLEPAGIQSIRVYASGENLFTFNSYREGWDPEINSGGAYYPILATYTLGVNARF
ncbi:SusC/RagA family TonB-linked outer membrane protein [Flexithrix dorotheae]|uniref:SusC/RagA family TonB-linked outer membrane protein n=1 Tax=Flexithrix dorotheae TaxID=70993 RepID=UPI0003AA0A2D|nr:SusC/RagA family TonB-linked outer membrane protein [Flexithrix dorotheae]